MVGMQAARMPRLDGLRAIAVFAVLVEHFAPNRILRGLSPGPFGVTLFFVLSGFLITRILIGYRSESIGRAAFSFYWRRFLRLSPPFYLVIMVSFVANVMMMRETWWIHAFYLTNFQLGLSGQWTGGADHFWSLAVEEQFYLLWFVVVVAMPKHYLLPAIWLSVATTLAFRTAVLAAGLPELSAVLLPGNIACLAIGALLAQARSPQDHLSLSETTEELRWFDNLTLDRRALIATGFLACAISAAPFFTAVPTGIFYPFIVSAFAVCLIAAASMSRKDIWLDWLAWAPLRYLGQISYGIYVYHPFIRPLALKIPGMAWIEQPTWPTFFFLVTVSVAVSHLSWKFIESPILRLKDYTPKTTKLSRLEPAVDA